MARGAAPQRDGIPADRLAPAVLAAANINPVTRLATDYLNHFNTIVMLLDMIPDMPECAEEIAAWAPLSYPAYFAQAHFRERELAVAAYHAAPEGVREDFDAVVGELDAAMGDAQRLLAEGDAADPRTVEALHVLVSLRLKPLISKASGIVNGAGPSEADDIFIEADAQDTIDELFH
ncbi:hypothetical protein [Prosthecomicrobium sp. N25]|uniref:hypothetical protein n=1 Tax=Prosthecomicrobium sp. N25 TaxID=3129254 RepID=UPI003076D251